VSTEKGEITSTNVILAIGSVPKKLACPGLAEISTEAVLDPQQLALKPLDGATVAVFGSSHSTMIALPNLLATPVTKVINFYRSPLTYAVYLKDWTLFDDIGLKGRAACWARENIDGYIRSGLRGAMSAVRNSTSCFERATTLSTPSDLNAGNAP
jgi:hypothetical protein